MVAHYLRVHLPKGAASGRPDADPTVPSNAWTGAKDDGQTPVQSSQSTQNSSAAERTANAERPVQLFMGPPYEGFDPKPRQPPGDTKGLIKAPSWAGTRRPVHYILYDGAEPVMRMFYTLHRYPPRPERDFRFGWGPKPTELEPEPKPEPEP